MSRFFVLIALALVLASSIPLPVAAAELAGVAMKDRVDVDGETLVLNGLGLRKKAIFKVYVGGLYLPAKESDAGKILAADGPRRTVMEFLRKVSKAQLCGGWEDGLANNTPGASPAVAASFEKLCGWMEDVGTGERIVFTYASGETKVEVRGVVRGSVPGKAFADALFACWLGPAPPSEEFRDGMLGR